MKTSVTKMIGTAALMTLATAVVVGHGGHYSGPQCGGGPGYNGAQGGNNNGTGGGGYHGPQGGGSGGNGTTQPPSTGGTGPVRPGGAVGGGGSGVPGGRSTTPGGKKATKSDPYGSWDWWWELNDDRFLNLKKKLRLAAGKTDNSDLFLGTDSSAAGVVVARMTETLRRSLVPVLKVGLKDPDYDTRAAAVIALGKVALGDALLDMKSVIADEHQVVRESACLALGILGNADAIPFLLEVARDNEPARRAMGRREIEKRPRAFAAIALGLIGARVDLSESSVTQSLVAILADKSVDREIRVASALSLGLMKARRQVPVLLQVLNDLAENDTLRSAAASSLAKIGDRSVLPSLIESLTDQSSQVSRAAAIALGALGDPADKRMMERLRKQARSNADRATRNFAIIALGELGGVDARTCLVETFARGRGDDKCYAALALGLIGRLHDDSRSDLARLIEAEIKSSRGDPERGAMAIALGLLGATDSVPTLIDIIRGGASQELKGHACTALGLLDAKDAESLIQGLVRQKGDLDLRRRAAVALGLLGDSDAVDLLKRTIEESAGSLAVHGSATIALGYIGDSRAIDSLERYVLNVKDEYKDATRAFAATALGLLGDKDDVPVLSAVPEHLNYLAPTDALAELFTIL